MTSRATPLVAAAVLFLLATWPPTSQAAVVLPFGFQNDVIVGGLNQPTSFAFLPDGRVLFTEQKTGRVRMIVDGHIAATDPVFQLTDVNTVGFERGLQGIAVDPAWPARRYVYLYYNRVGGKCRLVRYSADGDGEMLWLYGPLVLMDDILDGNPSHNGGGMRFGAGRKLFLSLGDDEVPCAGADSTSLRGAILRLDVGGTLPDSGAQVLRGFITPLDNPLNTSNANARLVWGYGMRNPWRFDVDTLTGATYVSDVGEADFEEIDELIPGDFLGWPWREGLKIMTPSGCSEPGGSGANKYKSPIVSVPHAVGASSAIICAGIYRPSPVGTSNWPIVYYGYYGDLFYGDYFSGYLRRLKKLAGQWATPPAVLGQPDNQNWATGLFAAVDFHLGADGSLYWMSQYDATFSGVTGALQRIRYQPPQADVEPARTQPAPLTPAPNPFSAGTDLSFRLDRAAPARLEVFDLAGRRVRTLWRGTAPAGETRVRWSGDDNQGAAVPPGVYIVRLTRGGRSSVLRVLRLK